MARVKRYRLYGKYSGGSWEKIDDSATRDGVLYLLQEYRLAFGANWKFEIRYGTEREAV